jgi:hypothetical protein
MQKSINRNRTQYDTWYAFKKDLELYLWCHLDNALWLKIKPKKALPWYESDMRTAIYAIFKN